MASARTLSPRTLDMVAAALGDEPRRPYEIHKRVDTIARVTVRQALRDLVAAGRAEFTGPECNRRYRRKAAA